MATVELKQLVGHFRDPRTGNLRRAGWNMDQLFLNGRQIATINRVPGSPVGLMAGVMLTGGEQKAVEDAIAAARGGVKPSSIRGAIEMPFELLDDDDDEATDETDIDEGDDE
jgi:hypothetical protein